MRRIYCQHTSSQNKVIERKNRYVIETSLVMLMRYGVLMSNWDDTLKHMSI